MSKRRWLAVAASTGVFSMAALTYIVGQQSHPVGTGKGDPSRGQAILEGKGNCLSCHRVADRGSRMGPDLSSIGSDHTRQEIEHALLDPSREVRPQFRLYEVRTKAGKSYTGRLMNQDRSSIQMLDNEDHLRTFSKSDLADFRFVDTPPMPSYRDKLTPAEQADLLAYLDTLKGVVRQ
jgi:putative heme-binding domain-containing protein